MKESLPSWTYFSCLFSNCCSVYLSFPLFHFPNALFVFNWWRQPSHLERETGGRVYRGTNFGCFFPCSSHCSTWEPSVNALNLQMGFWDTEEASTDCNSGTSPGFQMPTPSYTAGSSGCLSPCLWKSISYSFQNDLLPSLGICTVHAQTCMGACTHTHTHTPSLSFVRV